MRYLLLLIWFFLPAGVAMCEEADLVLKNGTILTMEPSQPRAGAVAVKGDRIVWIGDAEGSAAWIGKNTKVIDLKNAFVYPGLIESHAHILSLGSSRVQIDLVGTPDKKSVVDKVRERVAKSRKGDWIQGRGWDQNDWPEKKFPTAADLDVVSPDNPVVLGRVDGHAVWVNSRALQIAGITAATKDPDGGKILRDEKGSPAGVLVDRAVDLVELKMKALT
ncbi:MAG TPA: amidohydrolase family protein, partial [Acidobacteriota bacterium]|nr:amidohydrolase family protein [Acidobacteriota bacterium]